MAYGNGGTVSSYGGGSATISGISGVAPTPPPVATIPQALDAQAKAVSELHDVVDQVESHLSLVLGPEGQEANNNRAPGEPMPLPPHVFDRIQDYTRGINLAMGRLHRLMQRLQL